MWRWVNWCLLCGKRERNGAGDLCAICEGEFAETLRALEEDARG